MKSRGLFGLRFDRTFSMMAAQRILIAGAGAIGSVVGAHLHQAGHRVTMLGRPAHLAAIARDGLHVTGLLGESRVRGLTLAADPAELGGRYDLILCTVKPYDTASIADAISDRLDRDGIIVSMQNGLGNIEALAERFSISRVLGARVIFGAEIPHPGAAHVTVFADPVAIGPDPKQHRELAAALETRAHEIAATLGAAGVPALGYADIMPIIWTKLVYNAALNPLGALFETSYGALAADTDLRAIMDDLIEEAFEVAARAEVRMPFSDARAYREVFYGRLIPATASHRPTMLSDLDRRARTDIDALNGKIVELGARHGIDAPINATMVRMIHGAERRRAAAMAAENSRTEET
ncbi:MAG: ketopantoate reductase family protein [Candidatus Binataceae bacterium]